MNFERAHLLIKKITDFMNSLQHDTAEVLPIERQLLVSYVRELEQTLLQSETAQESKPEISQQRGSDVRDSDAFTPYDAESSIPDISSLLSRPVQSTEIDPQLMDRIKEEPVLKEQAPQEIEEEVIAPTEERAPLDLLHSEAEVDVHTSTTESQPKNMVSNTRWEEVFSVSEAQDLSERLAETKLESLSSAMGINEKIYTINELFGGNADKYEEVIQRLHDMRDMASAKKYLISEVAETFEWDDNSRLRKANQFVRMVRRLYL